MNIEKKFDLEEAIEEMNSLQKKIRNYKIKHPEKRLGFQSSYGGY